MMCGLQIDVGEARAERKTARVWGDANQRETRKTVRVGPANADVRVFDRLLWKRVVANEVVTEAGFVQHVGPKRMNVLNREQAMIELSFVIEARHVRSVEHRQCPRRICQEEFWG